MIKVSSLEVSLHPSVPHTVNATFQSIRIIAVYFVLHINEVKSKTEDNIEQSGGTECIHQDSMKYSVQGKENRKQQWEAEKGKSTATIGGRERKIKNNNGRQRKETNRIEIKRRNLRCELFSQSHICCLTSKMRESQQSKEEAGTTESQMELKSFVACDENLVRMVG